MTSAKKTLLFLFVSAGLAALAAAAYYGNRVAATPSAAAGAPAGNKASGGPPGAMAVGVEAVKVELTTLPDDVAAVGTLLANESVILRPEIAGRIARIEFTEGMPVAKGALLVALDASTQAADLQQARANLALSQANYKRTVELLEKKFVSERSKDEAAANLKVQQAVAAQAEARLSKTRIVAPFAAVAGIRNVSVGDYVKEGQDLVNLEDISILKVDFKLPERYFSRVATGQEVELSTDARPAETFKASIAAVDPLIDSSGRAVALRAHLSNADAKLRPGMFVRVRLIFGSRKDVMIVPEETLVPSGSDQYLFRISDGKAERVKVGVGVRRGTQVEITQGVRPGDLVVTAGQLKLRDGAPVKVMTAGGDGGAGPSAAPAGDKR